MRSSDFSPEEKSALMVAWQHLIDDFLKPRFLSTIRPTQFNYAVDILGKWHGTKYRFIQRYRSGFPQNRRRVRRALCPPRLDQPQSLRPSVALPYRRIFCLHRGLTLVEAIDTRRSEGVLHPV
jgi:hypothetical protein